MPQTPPPPEHQDAIHRLIGKGGHLARWLITEITRYLAPRLAAKFDLPYLRWLQRHYILPAEAVLRRTIHLIAQTLPPLAPPAPRAVCHPGERRDPALREPKPRTPLFSLTEPQPRPSTNYLPVNQRPRISVAGIAPPSPAKAVSANPAEAFEARLRRRLAALDAAWNAPDKAARRLLRLRARGAVRQPALSFTNIPGARADTLDETAGPILTALNEAVRTLDTS